MNKFTLFTNKLPNKLVNRWTNAGKYIAYAVDGGNYDTITIDTACLFNSQSYLGRGPRHYHMQNMKLWSLLRFTYQTF